MSTFHQSRRRLVTSEDHRRAITQEIGPRNLAGVILLVMLVTVVFGLVHFLDRIGTFDGDGMVTPVVDSRKRVDSVAEIRSHPIRTTTVAGQRVIYCLPQGRLIVYDPVTGLFSDLPPLPDELRSKEIVQIRHGSGNEDDSAGSNADCLFARTDSQALAVLAGNKWKILLHDSAFTGPDGLPVPWSDVCAGAVSGDRRYLLFGCRARGLGLYDVQRRRWQKIEALEAALALDRIREIVWWESEECFVIGARNGVALFQTNGSEQRFLPVESLSRSVLDLHAQSDGPLWLLDSHADDGARRIARWDDSDSPPVFLVDEGTIHPELAASNLQFAMQLGPRLYVAGTTGVYVYDCPTHAWKRLSRKRITCTLPTRDGTAFYAGCDGAVELFPAPPDSTTRVKWKCSGQVNHLVSGNSAADAEIIALVEGTALSLKKDGTTEVVFAAPTTTLDPKTIHSAYQIDPDHVLFVGDQPLQINTRSREYITRTPSPDESWVNRSDMGFATTPSYAFFVTPQGEAHVCSRGGILNGSFAGPSYDLFKGGDRRIPLRKPFAIHAMPEDRAAVLDQDSMLKLVSYGSDPVTLAGERYPGRSPVDIAGTANTVAFLDAGRRVIHVYDLQTRRFTSIPLPASETGRELAVINKNLVVVTNSGAMLEFPAEGDTWPAGSRTRVLLGGNAQVGADSTIGITDSELTDVRRDDDNLYLVGDGRVVSYSTRLRRVVNRWSYAPGRRLRIRGVVHDRPVVEDGVGVYVGDTSVVPANTRVLTATVHDAQLWVTLQSIDGVRKLVWFPDCTNTDASFVFYSQPMAEAGSIIDAISLPTRGEVLVSTDRGLRIYGEHSHAWAQAGQPDVPDDWFAGASLYRLGDSVLLAREMSPSSCELAVFAAGDLKVTWDGVPGLRFATALPDVIKASAYAVNERTHEFAFIRNNGAIARWSHGNVQDVVPPTGDAPDPSSIRRIAACDGHLVFATRRELWSYRLATHEWQSHAVTLKGSVAVPEILSIEHPTDSLKVLLTARTTRDSYYFGEWDAGTDAVSLQWLYSRSSGYLGDVTQLVDVQVAPDGRWTFVEDGRLVSYDPVLRGCSDEVIEFPDAAADINAYGTVAGQPVATNGAGSYWIGDSDPPTLFRSYRRPEGTAAVALGTRSTVYELTNGGQVNRLSPAAEGSDFKREPIMKPLPLVPAQVRHAFEWRDLTILFTDDGVKVYDEDGQRPVDVDQPATTRPRSQSTSTPIAMDRGSHLWIVNNRMAVFVSGTPPTARVFDDVDRFVPFSHKRDWARIGADWMQWNVTRASFERLPDSFMRESEPRAESRFFVTHDYPPVVIDRTSRVPRQWNVVDWDTDDVSPLPAEVDVETLNFAAKWKHDWWLLRNDELLRLRKVENDSRLELLETLPLPSPVGRALADEIVRARSVGDDMFELVGRTDGVRIRMTKSGAISLDWWTRQIDDVEGARLIDSATRWLYYSTRQRCGWVATAREWRSFVLLDRPRPDAQVPLSFDGGQSWAAVSARGKLSSAAIAALDGEPVSLHLQQPDLPVPTTGPDRPANAVVTAQQLTSRAGPARGARKLVSLQKDTRIRLMNGLFTSRHNDRRELWYQAVYEDACVLMARSSELAQPRLWDRKLYRELSDGRKVFAGRLPEGQQFDIVEPRQGDEWSVVCVTNVDVGFVPSDDIQIGTPTPDWRGNDAVRLGRFLATPKQLSVTVSSASGIHCELNGVAQNKAPRRFYAFPAAQLVPLRRDDWLPRCGLAPDGTPAYHPITRLSIDNNGVLQADRPDGSAQLSRNAAVLDAAHVIPRPSLNLPWLKWDRRTKRFDLTTVSGVKHLAPERLLRDGRFIFDHVESVIMPSRDRPCFANRYGVWQYVRRDQKGGTPARLSLQDWTLNVRLHDSGGVPLAFANQFIFPDGSAVTADNRLGLTAPTSLSPLGSATFRHSVQTGGVLFGESAVVRETPEGERTVRLETPSITIKRSNKSIAGYAQLFTTDGFAWDDRSSVACVAQSPAAPNRLLVTSAVAVHSPLSLDHFEQMPGESGRLYSRSDEQTFLHDSTMWYRRSTPAEAWKRAANPKDNRELHTSGLWKWRIARGRVRIEFDGHVVFRSSKRFAPFEDLSSDEATTSLPEVFFTCDLVSDVAVHDGRLHVLSQAMHQDIDVTQLKTWPEIGIRLSSRKVRHVRESGLNVTPENVQVMRDSKGISQLYRIPSRDNELVEKWNGSEWQAVNASINNPFVFQLLAETPRLRFTRGRASDGSDVRPVTKTMQVEDHHGRLSVVAFTFSARVHALRETRFPFDYVRTVAWHRGNAFVGTDSGLQVYRSVTDTDLHRDLMSCVDFDGPVDRIGVSVDDPETLLVRSARVCAKTLDGDIYTTVARRRLDTRQRHRQSFWIWRDSVTESSNVHLEGNYVSSSGSTSPVSIKDGRLLHEALIDFEFLNGETFTLWGNGWITMHDGSTARVDSGFVNFDCEESSPIDLFVVRHPDMPGTTAGLKRGIYYRNETGQVWRFVKGGQSDLPHWKQVESQSEATSLAEYGRKPPRYLNGRIRVLPVGGTQKYEHRALNGRWMSIPWSRDGRRLACDNWDHIVCMPDPAMSGRSLVWAGTSSGFCLFERDGKGRAFVVPDRLVVNQGSDAGIWQNEITDVSVTEHRSGVLDLFIRRNHDSGQVFKGQLLQARDAGTFRAAEVDPFFEQSLVDESFWSWNLVNSGGEQWPGHLACDWTFPDGTSEEVPFLQGRLQSDHIESLVVLDTSVNLVSRDFGWAVCQQTDDLHLRNWVRFQSETPHPRQVTRVFPARVDTQVNNPEWKAALGLEVDGDAFVLNCEQMSSIRPGAFLGDDGIWTWWNGDSVTARISHSTLGAGQRTYRDGRFEDDMASGVPVFRSDDGDALEVVIPTVVGIERRNERFERTGFTVQDVDTSLLYASKEDAVYYYNSNGDALVPIDHGEQPISLSQCGIPADSTVIEVVRNASGEIIIRWLLNGRVGWSNVTGDINEMILDASQVRRFRQQWSNPKARVRVKFRNRDLVFLTADSDQTGYTTPLPPSLGLRSVVHAGSHLVIAGESGVYTLNLAIPISATVPSR